MAEHRFGFRAFLAISAVMLVLGGASVYATFNLTGSGQITVTPPTVSAVFVSGQAGGKTCLVTGGGTGLNCPAASMQVGGNETLTFLVKNTGTIEVNLAISVTPVNASVLYVSSASGSSTVLAVGSTGTYTYVMYGLNTGSSAFKINVSPVPLPPQAG